MSLLLTFLELDKLYEAAEQTIVESSDYLHRQNLINQIKDTRTGRSYNLQNKRTKELSNILAYCLAEDERWEAEQEAYLSAIKQSGTCPDCGIRLTDASDCPKCSPSILDSRID